MKKLRVLLLVLEELLPPPGAEELDWEETYPYQMELDVQMTLRALGHKLSSVKFMHAGAADIDGPNGSLRLFSSYHCSRYNTNTGRLTEEMFDAVFEQIRDYLDGLPSD